MHEVDKESDCGRDNSSQEICVQIPGHIHEKRCFHQESESPVSPSPSDTQSSSKILDRKVRSADAYNSLKLVHCPSNSGISPRKALQERFKASRKIKRVTSKVTFPSSCNPDKFLQPHFEEPE